MKTPTATKAMLLDKDAGGVNDGPYVMGASEKNGTMELLSLDMETGAVRLRKGGAEAELHLPNSDGPPRSGKDSWAVRLDHFPATRLLFVYAQAGKVAVSHPSLTNTPISVNVAGEDQQQFLNALDAAVARLGIRVQRIEKTLTFISALKDPVPPMQSWPIPLARSENVSAGALQLLGMAPAHVFDIYASICGYPGDRSAIDKAPGPKQPGNGWLVAGTDVTAPEAKLALETLLNWMHLNVSLGPDGKLYAQWGPGLK